MKIFVIYDVLSNSIVRVLNFVNSEVCLRFLKQAIKMPNSPFAYNIEDTVLVEVGSINEESLNLTADNTVNTDPYLNGKKYNIKLYGTIINDYFYLVEDYLKEVNDEERKNKDLQ